MKIEYCKTCGEKLYPCGEDMFECKNCGKVFKDDSLRKESEEVRLQKQAEKQRKSAEEIQKKNETERSRKRFIFYSFLVIFLICAVGAGITVIINFKHGSFLIPLFTVIGMLFTTSFAIARGIYLYKYTKRPAKFIAITVFASLAIICIAFSFIFKMGEPLKFTLKEDGTYTVELNPFTFAELETIEIPEEFRGKPVTEIAENAFKDNPSVKDISIPKSIKKIGKNAFYYCSNIGCISYSGEIASFEAIEKGEGWCNLTDTDIWCYDGQIATVDYWQSEEEQK